MYMIYMCVYIHINLLYILNTKHKYKIMMVFIFLIDLYWSIIAWQYCVSFCCTPKRISHMHTHVPIPLPT